MAESAASRTAAHVTRQKAPCPQDEGPGGGPGGRFRNTAALQQEACLFQPPAGLRQTTSIRRLAGQTDHSVVIFGPDFEPNNADSVLSCVNPSASSESEQRDRVKLARSPPFPASD